MAREAPRNPACTGRYESEGRVSFAKVLALGESGRLEAERDGLEALSAAAAMRVPAVEGEGQDHAHAWLLLEWLEQQQPDVLCLQETKVLDSAFPLLALQGTGYHVEYRGKSAYNGVATLTREKPEHVCYGFREGEDDEDDRLLLTRLAGVTIINTYVPQGYRVTLVRFEDGVPTGREVFADGWLRRSRAWGRPVALLQLPDGSVLVSDDGAGAVYRLTWEDPASR